MNLSVVITSYNRPERLRRAVASACAQQTVGRVIVVDDCSREPPTQQDFSDARVLVLRQSENRGVCRSRNVGLAQVTSDYVVFLDDDDHLAEAAFEPLLKFLEQTKEGAVVPSVAVGTLLVARGNRIVARRLPPSSEPGQIWGMDEFLLAAGKYSFNCKQAAVYPTAVLQELGGWNESLRSRSHSELFFRLCQSARIVGIDHPVYILNRDPEPRLTADTQLREASYSYLLDNYGDLLKDPARKAYFSRTHERIMAQSSGIANRLERIRLMLRDRIYALLH